MTLIQCPDPPDVALPPAPASSNLAAWLLAGLLVGVLLLDYFVLYKRGKPTISEWLKGHIHPHVLKALGAGLIGLLLWHLFLGGPL